MARKSKKGKSAKRGKSSPRLLLRLGLPALVAGFLGLCVGADLYVHHPAPWLAAHRSALSQPLEWLGDRTAALTDAFGWTGHDTVYESDDPAPEGLPFFAGAPERHAAPATADVEQITRRGCVLGWSATLKRAEWIACRIPRDANDPELTQRLTDALPLPEALAQGPWRDLMHRIATKWPARYGELWVICGSVKGSPSAVPTRHYALVAAQTAEGVRTLAVLFDATTPRTAFAARHVVTVNELEQATGYRFFPDMPKFLRTPLKADRPTRLWPST